MEKAYRWVLAVESSRRPRCGHRRWFAAIVEGGGQAEPVSRLVG